MYFVSTLQKRFKQILFVEFVELHFNASEVMARVTIAISKGFPAMV